MIWRLFLSTLVIVIGLLSFTVYTLHSAQNALTKVPSYFMFGPEDADLEVVGFLDYSCTHCREAWPAIMEAVKKDGKVRFAPLLIAPPGSDDAYAVRMTYAAALQNNYRDVFSELITNYRPVDEKELTDIALKLNINEADLRVHMNEKDTTNLIAASEIVFKRLGGHYTPTFFIGPRIKYVPTTTPTADDFLKIFQEARIKAGKISKSPERQAEGP
jgi:protein-disulfide isomerase